MLISWSRCLNRLRAWIGGMVFDGGTGGARALLDEDQSQMQNRSGATYAHFR